MMTLGRGTALQAQASNAGTSYSSHFRGSAAICVQRPAARRSCLTSSLERVRDIMTSVDMVPIITCTPDDSVDRALELLVEHKITGLPVVDANNVVVGVVSDFDLLALENFGRTNASELFPETDQTWQAFKQVNSVLAKGTGKKVSDVMTSKPLTMMENDNINDATSILLRKKIRRLPVVDAEGRLIGLISRRDIVKAALKARQQAAA